MFPETAKKRCLCKYKLVFVEESVQTFLKVQYQLVPSTSFDNSFRLFLRKSRSLLKKLFTKSAPMLKSLLPALCKQQAAIYKISAQKNFSQFSKRYLKHLILMIVKTFKMKTKRHFVVTGLQFCLKNPIQNESKQIVQL